MSSVATEEASLEAEEHSLGRRGGGLVEATALDSTLQFAFVVLGEESKKAIRWFHAGGRAPSRSAE